MTDYTENSLVEQPAIEVFGELGWQTLDCYDETYGANGTLGREHRGEVVLVARLRAALERLNSGLPSQALHLAIEDLVRDRGAMGPVAANQDVYRLLKNGVKVTIPDDESLGQRVETVRLIDWQAPQNNDFFLASQFWVTGEMYTRRPDLVGFVNGIPLVLVELKSPGVNVKTAYNDNLRDYKTAIPQLFWFDALIVLSNGGESRVGSTSAKWHHFHEWKKINEEGEEGVVSLDTMIRGTCEPARLLDLVENFTLFSGAESGLVKITGMNHQYLGVNNAFEALKDIRRNHGRLGVYWHTQGSGKSYSMIFFAQKVFRKLHGNWTFVIITDRKDLDDQIYKNFARAGAVTEPETSTHAQSSAHLRQLLHEDHRYVFTLIQKFGTDTGKVHPMISDRSNIIVMTDEAHRSQYDTLALNMRNALPNAAFIGFTGTPLMVGEEKTRQVFGDYVSIYNFRQSVEDNATVPLYYENRIPQLKLSNPDLNADMERLLEEAELDEAQEHKLEREFAREYQLITRDERLDAVAEDIVAHFMGRGFQGKAMVVSIDKATAVRMYDKVQKYWRRYLDGLYARFVVAKGRHRAELEERIAFMEETGMAVVVSQAQNEIEDLEKKGADIVPHRKRMVEEDLDEKFKDPDDPFRIVFVCAMWMTGFDVPSCSTIYLDKPMRNHTLMQTIARANRVFGEKHNGLIVDYVGVFRDPQRALAIYGSGAGGGIEEGDTPVRSKEELIEALKAALGEASAFCHAQGVDLEGIMAVGGFDRVARLKNAVELIIVNDETKKEYLRLAGNTDRLFRAILPDQAANQYQPDCSLFRAITAQIRSLQPNVDISEVTEAVEALLDESIIPQGKDRKQYVIRQPAVGYETKRYLDLSEIDFDTLRDHFQESRRRTEVEKLRGAVNSKLQKMVRLNRQRMDYYHRFQEMIDEYNRGAVTVEETFERLLRFAQSLDEEERRGVAEGLTEEELALFDLLTRPDMKLNQEERAQVRKVSRVLLERLNQEKLVLDWRKRQQSRAAVQVTIEKVLDRLLPEKYSTEIYERKCDQVYHHVYESYYGEGRGIYDTASSPLATQSV